ncbi:MAG: hypothetical protein KDI19_02400 [Pseudomonadales bacterium]|nr:hypothetical protein [Pseudomonadales bacterium]
MILRAAAIAFVLLLGGCSFFDEERPYAGPSVREAIASAKPVLSANEERAPVAERAEVLAMYERVASALADRAARYRVERRIAELKLAQAAEGESPDAYAQAIESLEAAARDTDSPGDAALISYQLARAHDMTGNAEAVATNLDDMIAYGTDPALVAEARFRRAETRFSAGDYAGARADYSLVAASDSSYAIHAKYMQGWATFKEGNLAAAVDAMTDTIASLHGNDARNRTEQELLDDAVRMSVIALDAEGGAQSLAARMEALGNPDWQLVLYRGLGEWYREKERFSDAAQVFETFVANNPFDPSAPAFDLERIETWKQGGFSLDMASEQLRFVERYDKASEFYARHGDDALAAYHDTLESWLAELASRAHANAQDSGKASDYLLAAAWYARYLFNFDGAPGSDDKLFLMAQARLEAGASRPALAAYGTLEARYPSSAHALEAAYARVSILEAMAKRGEYVTAEERIDADLAFFEHYPEDPRAASVLASGATLLFGNTRYEEAAAAAATALAANLQGPGRETAERVLAHSQFELGAFDLAEQGYRGLLESKDDDAIRERLLASIFKQGEAAEATGDLHSAIAFYDELSNVAPQSRIAIDAAYDVAGLYEQSGDLEHAADALVKFRDVHHTSPLVSEVPMRLVAIYERLEHFDQAANELLAITNASDGAPEVARQALYRAGELFLTANDTAMAINTFRDYAHRYESPLPERMEAMQHMDELYEKTGEAPKRRFWQRKKVAAYEHAAPGDITDRVRYLAATSAFALASDAVHEFKQIRLVAPVEKSLAKKQKAMKTAIDALQKSAEMGEASIANAATFEIGSIYQSLATSLIDSERPRGLSKLEESQYEILLEEQAYPFEEQAIDIHAANLARARSYGFDDWSDRSLEALGELVPARYKRDPIEVPRVSTIY